MNPENEKKVFEVNYDDIAQYLFEALVGEMDMLQVKTNFWILLIS
jgi:hypothetical protein